MKNNRWSVYKTKSKSADSPKPATKPPTIGKAGREGARVGQGRGGRVETPLKQSEHDTWLHFLNQIFPGWVMELKFHSKRRWRFDYAHERFKIAIEVEGGIWTKGRHTRGKGYLADCEKYNAAQIMGYRVMRYAPKQITEMIADVYCLLDYPDYEEALKAIENDKEG